MHYEACIQTVIDYWASMGVKVKKAEARTMYLIREQYISVIPWWCAAHSVAWAMRVDKWCQADWEKRHLAARTRRLQMPGPSHHMGSSNIDEFRERWSAAYGGEELTEFQAIALSHVGRATSDVRYNPEVGPETYSNLMVYSRFATYTEMGKAKYGPDWDPAANPLDGGIIMRMGGGKQHGRYALGDSTLDTASTPTLSQIRARSANPDIR
ncbi:unnamed protein product [Urochloa humidicola]